MSIYTNNGYLNRTDYLNQLAEEYALDREFVFSMADMLGPNEDFDGLINACQDVESYDEEDDWYDEEDEYQDL